MATSPFGDALDDLRPTTIDHRPHVDGPPLHSPSARARSGLALSPRWVRRVLFFGIWFGPILFLALIVVGDAQESPWSLLVTLPMTGLCMMLPWWIVGGWVARFMTPHLLAAMFPTIRCPSCHEAHTAVDRWNCRCGFHDHRDRNVFLFRCPNCGCYIGYFDCPCCDATILL